MQRRAPRRRLDRRSGRLDRPTTHANYRTEAERRPLWALADALAGPGATTQDDLRAFRAFLAAPDRRHPIWTVIAELKPTRSLTLEDLTRYRGFLGDPQLSRIWMTENGARYATRAGDRLPARSIRSASSRPY
ncbi:hypothetical protein [Burkholderia sp. SCN-KJ]|uniref:hypothetical protein n=1 Tax=Burkholderia sp. SCN-KJ TaxID=2969248 RepID=UPI00214FF654|nr:hypothetical protein [Burkholderia sp. SCN-KJ]MCR4470044.1 hypothetical protein [Burkholderia sp. SCN-KJ]